MDCVYGIRRYQYKNGSLLKGNLVVSSLNTIDTSVTLLPGKMRR